MEIILKADLLPQISNAIELTTENKLSTCSDFKEHLRSPSRPQQLQQGHSRMGSQSYLGVPRATSRGGTISKSISRYVARILLCAWTRYKVLKCYQVSEFPLLKNQHTSSGHQPISKSISLFQPTRPLIPPPSYSRATFNANFNSVHFSL